jgi:UDP-N-acetylmuramoyl-tripeptide--D-alanyl-D-alanine ligase
MKPIPLDTLLSFTDGHVRQAAAARAVTRVVTDSRKAGPEDVFVALRGERFDAHDFVPQVAAGGAAAVVVAEVRADWQLPAGCTVLEVGDTLAALQDLARGYRAWHQPLVVGLTGSNGKTSTKDLAAAVLSRRFRTRATLGNLNNHIGVPLTLLALEDGDECAVVEMGMNHPGEIKTLVDIAQPDAAVLTNVGMAHIEYMGSRDAIAWEKATLPANVPADGVVVLPAGDAYTPLIARHCQAQVLTAGLGSGDVRAFDLRASDEGTRFKLDFAGEIIDTFLPVLGEHMVGNAALAACLGWSLGVAPADIAAALASARLSGGRMQVFMSAGVRFINDSYNANPDSVIAALRTLAAGRARARYAVLGRMGELGASAEGEHRRVGAAAAELGLDGVLAVGAAEATWIAEGATGCPLVRCFADHATCAQVLRELVREGDAVLVKGSRSSAMENVLTPFQPS